MADAKTNKCPNPACSCVSTDKDKFCSAHCEAVKGSVEVVCQCGHASCSGSETSARG